MKRLRHLLALLLIAVTFHAEARTIHWLTFVDTTDENVGEIDVYGHEILYNRIIGVVNAALKDKGYKTALHDIYGARFSPEACKAELASLRVEPDDIVVFYYIGHGARSKNDRTQWPQMQFGTNYDHKFVPLEWVHNTIKGKGPRLAVTIGMCCNSYLDGLTAKSTLQFSPNFGNTYMNDAQIENLAKLFTDYKGDIILSSSTPGQPSGCILFNNKVIDAFTACTADATDGVMNGRINPDWNSYLGSIKKMVGTRIRELHDTDQTVQFKPNVTLSPIKDTSVAQKKKEANDQINKPTPNNSDKKTDNTKNDRKDSSTDRDDVINILDNVFNVFINTDLGDDERIEIAEKWLGLNSDIAKINVVTLGQDGDTQVGRQSLEDFVGRLATSHLLQGINVDDLANGQIYVREVYRR